MNPPRDPLPGAPDDRRGDATPRTQAAHPPETRPRTTLAVALGTAVLQGALYLWAFPRELQFGKYPRAAAQYLAGTFPPERILDFSPFYFYLHLVQRAFLPEHAVVWLQVGATAMTAALLFQLLLRFFVPWVALAGAVAFALTGAVTVYTPVLEPEPFLLLFLVGFLHFALGSTAREHLVAGVFLALAVAVRPSTLPLSLVVPVFFLVQRGQGGWARPTLRVLGPCLLVLAMLGVRNAVEAGHPSPLGMNAGFVFYEGNHPLSSGQSALYPPLVGELKQEIPEHPDSPHLTYRMLAERAAGREISTAEANRYWRSRALAFITDQPGRYVRLLGTKALFVVHDHARHDLVVAHRYQERLVALRVPGVSFALLSALALVGVVAAAPRWRALLLVYALLASQVALMLLVYVSERQRLAIVPCLVFFACAGLAFFRRETGWRRVLAGAGAALVALALFVPGDVIRDERHLWDAYRVADQSRTEAFGRQARDELHEAARLAAAAYAATPWLRDYSRPAWASFGPEGFAGRALELRDPRDPAPSARFDRAQLLLDAGRLAEAEALFRALHEEGHRFDRGYSHSSEPLYYLGIISSRQGRVDEAVERLRQGLSRTPGDPYILARLAALTGNRDYELRLARYFGAMDAQFLVGVAQMEESAGDQGVTRLFTVTRDLPEFWRVRIYLAAALGRQGESDLAVEVYREATAERQEQVLLEEFILPLFEELGSEGGVARREHGLALARHGRWDEAVEVLRMAREEVPGPEVEALLARLEELRDR